MNSVLSNQVPVHVEPFELYDPQCHSQVSESFILELSLLQM